MAGHPPTLLSNTNTKHTNEQTNHKTVLFELATYPPYMHIILLVPPADLCNYYSYTVISCAVGGGGSFFVFVFVFYFYFISFYEYLKYNIEERERERWAIVIADRIRIYDL